MKKLIGVRINGHLIYYTEAINEKKPDRSGDGGGVNMKGYATAEGYMGYVEDEYMLFASEADYRDYIECV